MLDAPPIESAPIPEAAVFEGTPIGYRVEEGFLLGKHRDALRCEDALVIAPRIVAVVDGATSKSDRRYDGLPGGLFAAKVLASALTELEDTLDVEHQVDWLRLRLRDEAERASGISYSLLSPSDRPMASMVYFLPRQRLLVSVGDCQALVRGQPLSTGKKIDAMLSWARSQVLRQHLVKGSTVEELLALECDPGRQYILPLLRVASYFQNSDDSEFSYAVMDGTPVPASLIQTMRVPFDAEVVLASDGYPKLFDSLSESEAFLEQALAVDPLCISELMGTKPLTRGQCSFDDRAYLRLSPDT